jgi:protein SCO1
MSFCANENMISRSLLLLIMTCLVLTATACKPKPREGKRYEFKGKVISVNKTERTAFIDHQAVSGYMGAMAMEFDIEDDAGLAKLEAGDLVTATLVVTEEEDWLENLIIAKPPVPDANASPGQSSAGPQIGADVPDFALLNQDGKTIHLAQYRGKALALTFIYTRCPDPDQCTLMSTNFAAIEQALQKEPELYQKTHLLSVTFDPDYDTPKVMSSYGAAHTGQYSSEKFKFWEFATGSKDQVKEIATYFGLNYFKDKDSGEDKVIHSLRTAVIGPDGKLYKLYRGNDWKVDEVVTDLKTLASGQK